MTDFDDFLIEPQFSDIDSRKDTDISVHLGPIKLEVPVISTNMRGLTGPEVCRQMHNSGGIGCLHRFFEVRHTGIIHQSIGVPYISSIGVKPEEFERFEILREHGQTHFCLDVAHGAQAQVLHFAEKIRRHSPNIWLIIGNFGSHPRNTTKEVQSAMQRIYQAADAIKVGIGPGSACTTRTVTGVGVNQVTALRSYQNSDPEHLHCLLCADGGMNTSGDIAKALASGASFVMTGALFRGAIETEDRFTYAGSASKSSYQHQNKNQHYISPEGIEIQISEQEQQRTISQVMAQIAGGLRSAFAYTGARNMYEFHAKAKLIHRGHQP